MIEVKERVWLYLYSPSGMLYSELYKQPTFLGTQVLEQYFNNHFYVSLTTFTQQMSTTINSDCQTYVFNFLISLNMSTDI
jgi:hypothetical protein